MSNHFAKISLTFSCMHVSTFAKHNNSAAWISEWGSLVWSKGATRGEAKGAEAPPPLLAKSKLRKKIRSFNF